MSRVVSFRLDEKDYQWLEQQGKVSDICKKAVLRMLAGGGLPEPTAEALERVLSAIESVDANVKEILERLSPREDEQNI